MISNDIAIVSFFDLVSALDGCCMTPSSLIMGDYHSKFEFAAVFMRILISIKFKLKARRRFFVVELGWHFVNFSYSILSASSSRGCPSLGLSR